MEDSKRIYFLDTLRSFIIFLVIFYHVTIHYVIKAQVPAFVENFFPKGHDSFFGILFLWINGQTMNAVMFFIAGYFALAPLLKKGFTPFLKDKLMRLGLPYLFGVIVLTPLASYIAYRSWGNRINYFKYWFFEFFKPQNYLQYQFWFLGVLLFFFLMLSLVFLIFKAKIKFKESGSGLSPLFAIFFVTFASLLYYTVESFYSASKFSNFYVIYFQTVMFLVYAAYFSLGVYAYRNDWFKTGYKPRIIPWTIIYLISTLIYLITLISVIINRTPYTTIIRLVIDFSFNISIFAALFMLLALFQKCLNSNASLFQKISQNSYSTYIVHYFIVYLLIYTTRTIQLPLFPKLICQIVVAVLVSWGLGYLLKRIPILSKIL